MGNIEDGGNGYLKEIASLKKKIAELEAQAGIRQDIRADDLGCFTRFANDFIILLDKDFYFLEVNKRVIDFYGYSRRELIGMHATSLRAPEVRGAFSEQVKPAQEQGLAVYETIHQQKGGERFPVEISLFAVDVEGKRFYQSVIRDISERKKNESQLQESYTLYQSLYENMSSGVAVLRAENEGKDFVVLGFNKAAERNCRISREQVVGKRVLEAFPALKEMGLFEVLRQVYHSGQPQDCPAMFYDDKRLARWFKNYVYKLQTKEIVVIYDDVTDAKNAQDRIKENEAFLDAIFENIPDMIFVKNAADLRFLRFNKAAQRLMGYSAEEMIGKNDFDLFPQKEAKFFTEKDRVALDNKTNIEIQEETLKTKSGENKILHTKKIPILDNRGNPMYLLGISEDVSERKKAEETLRASERLLESIMNSIPVRVFWKDKNLVYLGCNAIFAQDAGFADAKEIIGKDDYQMIWRDQADSYRNDDLQVIQSGKPKLLIEELQSTPKGKVATLLTNKIPLRDSRNEIIGILGSYLDITERKDMENALRDTETRYRLLFELSPEGIVIIEPETTRILEFNETACRQLGYSRQEFSGLSIKDFEVVETPEETRAHIADVMAGKRMEFETRHRCRNGQIKDIFVTAQIVQILGRRVYYCIWRDISEYKKNQEENAKRARELEIFYQASIGREERIIELKKEVERLKKGAEKNNG